MVKKTVTVHSEKIPGSLKSIPSWCLWKYVNKKTEKGVVKTKVPYTTKGKRAKTNAPDAGETFDAVWGAYFVSDAGKSYDGIGIILTDYTNITGVDVDHCLNGKGMSAQGLAVMKTGTYCEKSPSGEGIRAFFVGKKPGNKCKNTQTHVEMYDRVRFLTITGDRIGTNTEIVADQGVLDALYLGIFPEKPEPVYSNDHNVVSPEMGDEEILDYLSSCDSNGLWASLMAADFESLSLKYPKGDGTTDLSSADLAAVRKICFYTQNPEQIERIWGMTGLSKRDKFNRGDYRKSTIERALHDETNFFSGASEEFIESSSEDDPSEEVTSCDLNPEIATEDAAEDAAEDEAPNTDFPLWVFPDIYREHCEAISKSICCPIDFPATATLAAAAAMSGLSYLEIRQDWHEYPNLFCAIVAKTGEGKTPAVKAVLECSVYAQERILMTQNAEGAEDRALAEIVYQRELSRYKKSRETDDVPPTPVPEFHPQEIHMNDTTTEALLSVLTNNPKGVLIIKDEITSWVRGLDLYREGGKGTDRETYMSIHSCCEAKVSRKNKEPLVVQRPRVSLLGSVVPDNIQEMIGKKKDGFAERIIMSYPKSMEKREISSYFIPAELVERVTQGYLGMREDEVVTVTPDAFDKFSQFYNLTFSSNEYAGYKPKLVQVVARVALILCKMNRTCVCDGEMMMKAIAVANYFDLHMQKVLNQCKLSSDTKDTLAVYEWAKRKKKSMVTLRELVTTCVSGCPTVKAAQERCQDLVNLELASWKDNSKRQINLK